jgi:hypothetical protein
MLEVRTDGRVLVGLSSGSGFNHWSFTSYLNAVLSSNDYIYCVDINGNGRADLIRISQQGEVFAAFSHGGAGFDFWLSISPNQTVSLFSRIFFEDINGDGKADLIEIKMSGAVQFASSYGSGFNFWTCVSGNVMNVNSPVFFADINGDGRADLIAYGAQGAADAGRVLVAVSK